MTHITKTAVAALLSIALGVGVFTPAPARANEDVAKVLAGIVALYIASEALKDRGTAHAAPVKPKREVYVDPRKHGHTTRVPRSQRDTQAKVAPQRCVREQWTHRGVREVYGARCMAREARAQLPRGCVRRADTNSGPRRFYTKRCLRRHGWKL